MCNWEIYGKDGGESISYQVEFTHKYSVYSKK